MSVDEEAGSEVILITSLQTGDNKALKFLHANVKDANGSDGLGPLGTSDHKKVLLKPNYVSVSMDCDKVDIGG